MTAEDYLRQGMELAEDVRLMHCAETAIRRDMQSCPDGNLTPEEQMKYERCKRRLERLRREGAKGTERLLILQEEISQAIAGVSDWREREILHRVYIRNQTVPVAGQYMGLQPWKAWKLYRTALSRIQVPEQNP